MKRPIVIGSVAVLLYACCLQNFGDCNHRERRQLIYRDKSRFFLRVNIKNNVLNYTNIIALAVGFKVAWDVPHKPYGGPGLFRKKRDLKQEIASSIIDVIVRDGFSEVQCLLKYVCGYLELEASHRGFFYQMFDYVFRDLDADDRDELVFDIIDRCKNHYRNCDTDIIPSFFTDMY